MSWLHLRLRHHVVRLGLLAGLLHLAGCSLWPVAASAGLLILQEAALVVGRQLVCPWLLRTVVWLGQLARVVLLLGVVTALVQLVTILTAGPPHLPLAAVVLGGSRATSSEKPEAHDVRPERSSRLAAHDTPRLDPLDERLGAALAFSFALRNTPPPPPRIDARIELHDGTLRIVLPNAATVELPACSQPDQRLAMVIARLFKDDLGKPLFDYGTISRTFGKKHRQDSQNHMRAFLDSGESLAILAHQGRPGRHRPLSPAIERRLASYWERDPLASPEQCARWLATQVLPEGAELPSAERLAQITRLPGNLVTVRHSLARLLTRSDGQVTLRHDTLIARLFEVIDAQDRMLSSLAAPPIPRPGLLDVAAKPVPASVVHPTHTAQALFQALSPLTTFPDQAEDLALMSQVGLKELAPLHCATLYCTLTLSIGQIAALVGHSKSVVYRALLTFARAVHRLELFPPAQHFSGVMGLDEKWLKIPKSYSAQERLDGKKWRYAHFAVDARTGDLLHVDVYETSATDSARAFLVALRAMGLRPRVIVTDMWAGYSELIREVFGERVLHHFCLFHHLQAVRERLRQRCGNDWKQSRVLVDFAHRVDHIYHCQDRRTAQRRLSEVMALRSELEHSHPEAVPILELIEQRFPKVANALGSRLVPTTNDITERTIRAFNQHYKKMAGLESLETARVQMLLFRFFYRLTPQRETVKKEERGRCPLERAGWQVRGIPVADYIRRLTTALEQPREAEAAGAGGRSPPVEVPQPVQVSAA